MDKISGIIASTPRVAATDLRETATVRPGTPGFGRAEGANALRERELAAKAAGAQPRTATAAVPHAEARMKDERGATIARSMTDKFFASRQRESEMPVAEPALPMPQPAPEPARPAPIAAAPVQAARETAIAARPAFGAREALEIESEVAARPTELFPKGSFIDTRA